MICYATVIWQVVIQVAWGMVDGEDVRIRSRGRSPPLRRWRFVGDYDASQFYTLYWIWSISTTSTLSTVQNYCSPTKFEFVPSHIYTVTVWNARDFFLSSPLTLLTWMDRSEGLENVFSERCHHELWYAGRCFVIRLMIRWPGKKGQWLTRGQNVQ